MKTTSPSLSNIGRLGVQGWALDFWQRYGQVSNTPELRLIQMDERLAPDHENGYIRRAMGHIDFELMVCGLVYFRSSDQVPRKCREVTALAGMSISARTYWSYLDRLWYFMAGRMIERPPTTPYGSRPMRIQLPKNPLGLIVPSLDDAANQTGSEVAGS
jgi:hypothetical protein